MAWEVAPKALATMDLGTVSDAIIRLGINRTREGSTDFKKNLAAFR